METALLAELAQAVWREIIQWRKWVIATVLLGAFAVLGAGFFWAEQYETDTLLYADVTNIIQPLLKGKAEVTNIDRTSEVSEIIYTRRILKRVADDVGLIDPDMELNRQEAVISGLRDQIGVENAGKNFLRIVYRHPSPERSFTVLNAVVDAFIKDTSDRRRKESRDAYEFIAQQVEGYKRQLVLAEQQLKEFKSKSLDGTQASVNSRIGTLRTQIEELKLTIDESSARKSSLEQQIENESAYLTTRDKVDEQRERLAILSERLDLLRLSYQETYPDVVTLKEQIAEQQNIIKSLQGDTYIGTSSNNNSKENPLYEELRVRLSESAVDVRSQKKRLEAMGRMLEEEYARAERVASRTADLSELVRDYDVTKNIYEDMLESKEKARLSMTLDIEGQGVSYKIQEPAVYPLKPSGLQFLHFVIAGPLIGLLLPIGLIIAYVMLDPRVRSAMQLREALPEGIEILAVVPHVNTPFVKRLLRKDILLLAMLLAAGAVVYAGIAYARISGSI
ncbi:XrtA system polysaccharide chain length determinant [Dasania marina]|uniref:XrtA system polysaccharide chain length determinant n=1 Tax=Dasania marina TaxID=471499 RepID=UPI0003751E6E|nr:XrtA system polysaccharide chain length determinant [Dasania marina]